MQKAKVLSHNFSNNFVEANIHYICYFKYLTTLKVIWINFCEILNFDDDVIQ
jgi:hypothetical protein